MNKKEWVKTTDATIDPKTGQSFPATYRQRTAKEKLIHSAKELGIELDEATINLGLAILGSRDLSRNFIKGFKK